MQKRVRILFCVLLIIFAGVMAWQMDQLREPRYQGRRLSLWLADLDFKSASDSVARDNALRAVRAIGTNGLPRLAKMLCTRDSVWREALIRLDPKLPFFHMPVTSASGIRARALLGYGALGTVAEAGVPVLIQVMQEESSPRIRACAASALGHIGRSARAAVPVLRKATEDANEEVRRSAMMALASIEMWDQLQLRF